MLIKDSKLVVFDVETTGLEVETSRVVEFGAAIVESGSITRRRRLVNPGVPIPSEASRVHRITDDVIADAETFDQLWPRVQPYFEGDVTAAGYNAVGYDAPLVNAELERHGFEFRFDPDQILDAIIFIHYHLRGQRRRNLESMAGRYGIKASGGKAHSAAVDCQMTAELIMALVEDGMIPEDLDDALRQQRELRPVVEADYELWSHWIYRDRKSGRLRIGAGTHCGKLMADVPKSFYSWALGKMHDLKPDTKRLFQAGRDGRIEEEELQEGLPGLEVEDVPVETEWGGEGRKP